LRRGGSGVGGGGNESEEPEIDVTESGKRWLGTTLRFVALSSRFIARKTGKRARKRERETTEERRKGGKADPALVAMLG